ncbi:MAG: hypothetical protein IJ849_02240 [Selenomonadaceae bacterium]|nr:hypothetical protein [Selenomonadaceae bacterium]
MYKALRRCKEQKAQVMVLFVLLLPLILLFAALPIGVGLYFCQFARVQNAADAAALAGATVEAIAWREADVENRSFDPATNPISLTEKVPNELPCEENKVTAGDAFDASQEFRANNVNGEVTEAYYSNEVAGTHYYQAVISQEFYCPWLPSYFARQTVDATSTAKWTGTTE